MGRAPRAEKIHTLLGFRELGLVLAGAGLVLVLIVFGGLRIAVIIPAYNEARLLGQTLQSIPPFVDLLFVIDDASTDETTAIAKANADSRVQIIQHPVNRGVGAAIRTGYSVAFEAGADAAVVMAGDGQMDPRDLPTLLEPLVHQQADFVMGDRLSHPQAAKLMPRVRWLGNHLFARATRWITGLPVRDSQCGYAALSRQGAERLSLDNLWSRYGYPNDLLGAAREASLRFRHVVVRPVYGREVSGIRLRDALFVIPFVLGRVLWRRFRIPRTKTGV